MPLLTTQSARGYGITSFTKTIPATSQQYVSIATYALTSDQGTITFSSIPQTYKHLELRVVARGSYNSTDYDGMHIRFNNSSASNYYAVNGISYNGNTLATGQQNGTTYFENVGLQANVTRSNEMGSNLFTIIDYTASKGKTVLLTSAGKRVGTGGYQMMSSLFWNDTSAINRIDLQILTPSSYNFKSTSHFALYGIKG